MKAEQMTDILEQAATHVGIRVRYEAMTGDTAGAGGLCKVKGEWCLIVDRKTPAAERVALLIEALAGFDTENVYLPPELREAVAMKRSQRAVVELASSASPV
jgi:hypothetical protein